MNETAKMASAKVIVSSSGAWELSEPSLLCPFLLLKKDPMVSPAIQAAPRVNPMTNAAPHSFPNQNQSSGVAHNTGSINGLLLGWDLPPHQ